MSPIFDFDKDNVEAGLSIASNKACKVSPRMKNDPAYFFYNSVDKKQALDRP
jgi:hypothetical protein